MKKRKIRERVFMLCGEEIESNIGDMTIFLYHGSDNEGVLRDGRRVVKVLDKWIYSPE